MNECKLSIIVPVYGVEKYIDKCLNSLVKQSLKEIEIIVVNDGSPDNSQKIIDKYVKKYPEKVQSFIKENGGQGSARNIGIVKAKGEYMQQKLSELEGVAEVRGIGMMIGIVLEKGTAKDVAAACIEHGLLVLTAKTLVRLLPPLTITFEEIDKGLAILEEDIKQA